MQWVHLSLDVSRGDIKGAFIQGRAFGIGEFR
jgi:hypothetical protein